MSDSPIANTALAQMYDDAQAVLNLHDVLTGNLQDEQIQWQPAQGGWCIGQCLEHMILVADLYDGQIRPALEKAEAQGIRLPDARHRFSLFGKMLLAAMDPKSSRKLKTFGMFAPPAAIRANVAATFRERHGQLMEFIRRADGLDFSRIRFASPASRLLRLNLGDAILILNVHAERHLRQIDTIAKQQGFPESRP